MSFSEAMEFRIESWLKMSWGYLSPPSRFRAFGPRSETLLVSLKLLYRLWSCECFKVFFSRIVFSIMVLS